MILKQVNGDKIVQHIDKEQNNMSVAENVAIERGELLIVWPFLLHFQHPEKQHSIFV